MTRTNNPLFKDLYEEAWKLVRFSFLLTLSFSLSTFSIFSYDFKCFISKDSNIAGFTICADWDKASRSYEISIVSTYAASIVYAPHHFVDAGDNIMFFCCFSFCCGGSGGAAADDDDSKHHRVESSQSAI
jgi:hypothetical protein